MGIESMKVEQPNNPSSPEVINGEKISTSEMFEVEALQKKVSELEEKIRGVDEAKLTPEQKGRFERVKGKVTNASRKFLNAIKWATLVVGTVGVVNYERTHTNLEVINHSDGTHEYHHQDIRTTHLLNVLAGKEKFSEQDLRVEFDHIIKEMSSQMNQKLDKDPSDMTLDELDEAAFSLLSKTDATVKRGDFKESFLRELQKYNEVDTNSEWKTSDNIYELVWQMEKETGNPKIRFTAEDLHFIPMSSPNGTKHYDPVSNTIFIDPSDISPNMRYSSFNDLAAELSHGKQFKERPLGTTMQYVADVAGVLKRGGLSMDKLTKEYQKLYDTPGSFEHDAHKVIEPYLLQKYKFFVKK